MAKTKISEYSSTANSNTDIASINIDEGCAPSGINNAIRALMAQLKDFQTGAASDPVTVGGVLTVTGGSAAAPAITTSGDTNTGVLFPAADTVGITTGGTERVRVDSSGNVGIGTSSPNFSGYGTTNLTVSGGTTIQGVIELVGTRVDGDGFAAGDVNFFANANSAGNKRIAQIQAITNGATANNRGGAMLFATKANNGSVTERARIDSSGNVGIGTSSPGAKLHVSGSSASNSTIDVIAVNTQSSTTAALTSTGSTYSFAGVGANTAWFSSSGTVALGNYSAYPIQFVTNGAERARIDSSGNLLVGNSAASSVRLYAKGITADSTQNAFALDNSAGTSLFRIRNDGVIYTGGATYSPYNNTTGVAANMVVGAAGDLYRSTSSIKYKKNVVDAVHGLSDLLNLRAVTYEGKSEADQGKTFGGLIAEEVHEAGLTEFVQYAEDGTPDALAYGNMVSLCIKAIQEQQALINNLTERLAALEAK